MYRLITKQNRQQARQAWIAGRPTEKYKDLEILCYKRNNPATGTEYFVLAVWKGTSGNPLVNCSYKQESSCQREIKFLKELADKREHIKMKKKAAPKMVIDKNLLKKGDLFYCSWGYDQTNYDYLAIMEVSATGKTVKCQMTSALHMGQSCQSNVQEPIFCPHGKIFTMQVRQSKGQICLVGSYPFCGDDSKQREYFSRCKEGEQFHETMLEFGH